MKLTELTLKQFQLCIKGRLNRIIPLVCHGSRLSGSTSKKSLLWNISPNIPSSILPNNIKYIHYSPTVQLQQTSYLSKDAFSQLEYEHVSDETLDSLTEKLEELIEEDEAPPDSDITFSSGVLTLKLGEHGTYVINKQTPNKQIWLSSPVSGPKRFDFQDNEWIYRHDGSSLHKLLSKEFSLIFKKEINLGKVCLYSGKDS